MFFMTIFLAFKLSFDVDILVFFGYIKKWGIFFQIFWSPCTNPNLCLITQADTVSAISVKLTLTCKNIMMPTLVS
jgi:hypothetical protein